MNAAARRLAPLIHVVALVLCVFLSLLVPAVYFFVNYSYQTASMEVTAEISTRWVSHLAAEKPESWSLETASLKDFLLREIPSRRMEVRRIVDARGNVITETDGRVVTPMIKRSRDIQSAGRIVGRLEVERSIRPLLVQTLFMAVVGGLLGLVVFMALRIFPLNALSRAENLFQEARERYQALADNSLLGIAVMDTNHRIINVNATFAALFNKPAEAFVGLHCFNEFEKRPAICPHCPGVRAMASRTTAEVETQGVRDDGSRFYVRIRAVPIFGIDGEVSGFIEIVENIDQQKRAEMERETMLHRQQEINQLQQFLLALSPLEDKLKLITDGIVRLFEIEFCHIWLIRSGDLCPKGCVHTELREGSHMCTNRDRCLHLVASSGKTTQSDCRGHLRVPLGCCAIGKLAIGTERKIVVDGLCDNACVYNREWVRELGVMSLMGYQLSIPSGEVLGVIGLFAKRPLQPSDEAILDGLSSTVALVVQEGIAEQSRRQIELQLQQGQKMESIGQLAAGIAHEINTPVQYVGDNLRFLQNSFKDILDLIVRYQQLKASAEKAGLTADIQVLEEVEKSADLGYLQKEIMKALEQSTEGVQRVARIVLAMKEFSHPDVGREMTMVDVNRVLKNTLVVAHNEWKYVADVREELDPDLPFVKGVQGELNQVFLNLIVNAAQAIAEKVGSSGERGLIVVSTRHDGKWIEIRISDTGVGIQKKHQSHIFELFFTTKGVGKGTGQGLAMAYQTVTKKHDGFMAFETEPGKGTTFIVHLPAVTK